MSSASTPSEPDHPQFSLYDALKKRKEEKVGAENAAPTAPNPMLAAMHGAGQGLAAAPEGAPVAPESAESSEENFDALPPKEIANRIKEIFPQIETTISELTIKSTAIKAKFPEENDSSQLIDQITADLGAIKTTSASLLATVESGQKISVTQLQYLIDQKDQLIKKSTEYLS